MKHARLAAKKIKRELGLAAKAVGSKGKTNGHLNMVVFDHEGVELLAVPMAASPTNADHTVKNVVRQVRRELTAMGVL